MVLAMLLRWNGLGWILGFFWCKHLKATLFGFITQPLLFMLDPFYDQYTYVNTKRYSYKQLPYCHFHNF